ncbi:MULTISPECIES: HesA/MoeB/ThiF family protein [Acetobacter]|uniref:Molybdopterin-synthase adenylyltransferase n=2 Tax=Acetobacter persici TaxID=1076596 RepID=A0A6V8IDF3_9PROT|nr:MULTISPECIES: molybdopterin-synthase adenylyltransferase MoeB [Acetobacter]MBS1000599.1 molybdopterin-synthase adenylyltransferase MoeB [Acetobacter persici]MBS1016164.1 molybdopterin-synthase adenylyltransferase MoeB [Acetobacter persici]MCG0998555.1 molybdopterin-synthase adenylyltransferase MoeB [Acetobacter persici]MCP9318798.1 molybdopterin-synthase adenylyltransferase MoeB [Acetobacter persici]OUI92210.1 adenylyltransferase [Acetobacter persici]
MAFDFTEAEIQRYSRHILLPEVGGTGQAALKAASVLVVGAGGLGAPAALYLAAAGVGRIGLVDDDVVELSNLQRQIVHTTQSVGTPKVESARATLEALNPEVTLETWPMRLTAATVDDLVSRYDLVCDGCDNFTTRYLVNAACVRAGKPLVSAAVQRFEGQLSTFHPARGGPCYHCLYPQTDGEAQGLSCGEAGVFGAVTGVMGTLQATEALKELLGLGTSLVGRLLMWDALNTRFTTIALQRDPTCPVCGALQRETSDG